MDVGRSDTRRLPSLVMSDVQSMASATARRATVSHVYRLVHYATDWIGWNDPIDDLKSLCAAQERQHRGSRRMPAPVSMAAEYFVLRTICEALEGGYHWRKTMPTADLGLRADYIKARAIVAKCPWLSRVIPPRVRRRILAWDYVTLIAGGA